MRRFLPLVLARRELRGGVRGFRILIACLALGVGTIATVQSLSRDVLGGIDLQGRTLVGGDVAIRSLYREATAEQLQALSSFGAVSESADLRAMARTSDSEHSMLVQVKAVDRHYPLVGRLELDSPAASANLSEVLDERNGVWGAAVDRAVLDRLGAHLGDRLSLGTVDYEVRAVIAKEPDRVSSGGFTLAPHFVASLNSLPATGLIQPGSLIYYNYRILLPPGRALAATEREITRRFAETGWHISDARDAAPELRRFITRLATFLTLVGLTALLVGGVGVGNAVKSYLEGRMAVIATMKCLGASGRLILWTYLIQVMALSAIGIAMGVAIGVLTPLALRDFIARNFPVGVHVGVHPAGLALAAAYGGLIALGFSLWPIGKARTVPAGALFRSLLHPAAGPRDRGVMAATALTLAALTALLLVTSAQLVFSAAFAGGAVLAFAVLGLAGRVLILLTGSIGRTDWVRRHPTVRLALANLKRPGAVTGSVVISLGLGLTILVAIAQVEGDFRGEVERTIPAQAPAFFFLDIQHAERAAFQNAVASVPGVTQVEMVPALRGRIVAARGTPVAQALVDKRYGWVLDGDRGMTYSATLPARSHLLSGAWWEPAYDGPPAVSVTTEIAQALALKIGDELTFNIAGRELTAKVANIRAVDWGGLGINFTLVFAPGLLEGAPQTDIATAYAPREVEPSIERVVNKTYPAVTMIGVRDALATVDALLSEIGLAVRLTAAVALIAGTLVLAGAIAAGQRRRVYDAVVLKVLGATRGAVLRTVLIEHGVLGLMAALTAVALGTAAAWTIIVPVMDLHWRFNLQSAAVVAFMATFVTLAFGVAGTWRALGQRSAPLLRNE